MAINNEGIPLVDEGQYNNIELLEQLYYGRHLNKSELKRASILIEQLRNEIKSRKF